MFTEALNIVVLRHSVRTRGRRQFKPSCERDMGGIHLITRFSQLLLAVKFRARVRATNEETTYCLKNLEVAKRK